MVETPRPLLILGASVRAAAQSAARARFTPICGDLFGDADLRAAHPCHVARRYPSDLAAIAVELPAMPWIYTGGLENHPALVARISQRRTLYGNPPGVLRRVRDPFAVSKALNALGVAFPECRAADDPPPRDGHWLLKHRRSSGGGHVTVWDDGARQPPGGGRSSWYFQRRMPGAPCGAVYVAAGARARLIGVTEQLLMGGVASPFGYAGSIGPLPLSSQQEATLIRLGDALAAVFELRGLFGVDVLIESDSVWPVEVNPRYTASVEVLERATGVKSIALHARACRDGIVTGWHPRRKASWCGKFVVYAPQALVVSAEQSAAFFRLNQELDGWPNVADLPVAGARVRRGRPLLTVFAETRTRASLFEMLAERRRDIERSLFRS